VVTDARRKEVYWAAYDASGARVDGPGVVRPEEARFPGPLVGDPRFADRLGAPVEPSEVTTAGLLHAAAALLDDPSPPGPLVPLYLRRPDAVPPTSFKPVTTA
jgi:tRNA A37 threonylcarbamoyladenosine modification protein TsaB